MTDSRNSLFAAEFKQFCRRELRQELQEIENIRKMYLFKILVCFAAVCIFTAGIIFQPFKTFEDKWLYAAEIIFAALPFLLKREYALRAQKIIFEKLLSFTGTFKLNPRRNIKEEISKLHLFEKFDTAICTRKYKGRYRLIDAEVFEIQLENNSKQIFNGILIRMPYFKNFTEYTVIKRKSPKNPAAGRINIRDEEFEKYYDIYSGGEIEAAYLLPEPFRVFLTRCAKKGIAGNISFSFEYGCLYIAAAAVKNWYNIPIFRHAGRIENYKAVILEIIILLKAADALQLDRQAAKHNLHALKFS